MTMPPSSGQRTLTITARIKPRSKTPGIDTHGADVIVRVRSLPIEGRANAEAVAVLADAFGIPKSRVELIAGQRSRIKRFRISAPARIPPGLES